MLVAVRLPTAGLYTKCWLVLLARLSLTRAVLCPMVYAWRSWQTELDERRPRTMTIAARPLLLSLSLTLFLGLLVPTLSGVVVVVAACDDEDHPQAGVVWVLREG